MRGRSCFVLFEEIWFFGEIKFFGFDGFCCLFLTRKFPRKFFRDVSGFTLEEEMRKRGNEEIRKCTQVDSGDFTSTEEMRKRGNPEMYSGGLR